MSFIFQVVPFGDKYLTVATCVEDGKNWVTLSTLAYNMGVPFQMAQAWAKTVEGVVRTRKNSEGVTLYPMTEAANFLEYLVMGKVPTAIKFVSEYSSVRDSGHV